MSAQPRNNADVNIEALSDYLNAVERDPTLSKVRFKGGSRWHGGCETSVSISHIEAGGEDMAKPERQHTLHVDEPPSLGGADAAANPVEYLIAGLCGCITAGIATNAALFGTDITNIEVEVDADFDLMGLLGLDRSTPTGAQRLHYSVRLKGPGSREALARAKETIDRKSPLVNTLTGGVAITTDVTIEEDNDVDPALTDRDDSAHR